VSASTRKETDRSTGLVHRLVLGLERAWDRLRPRDATPEPVIDAYLGYATPDGCQLRGRVLDGHRYSTQIDVRSRWNAFRNMARNFLTAEIPGVRVASGDVETVTDEEGYFQLTVPALPPGLHHATLRLPDHDTQTEATILVPVADAKLGIISDIDDTVMRTGAFSLARNLWTTATTFITDREVFADTVAVLKSLQGDANPVFYVSSSPWNLHGYLNAVFEANGVPRGPMFLRDFGVSQTKFIKSTHGSHKGDAIATILAANPNLDFVLIGDSGQHDALVYHDAILRHPGRIRQVMLRHAGPIDQADQDAADAIRRSNVDLVMAEHLDQSAGAEAPASVDA
jgi:phosphatidate phosphatase APP1